MGRQSKRKLTETERIGQEKLIKADSEGRKKQMAVEVDYKNRIRKEKETKGGVDVEKLEHSLNPTLKQNIFRKSNHLQQSERA